MSKQISPNQLQKTLTEVFQLSEFRPSQLLAIQTLFEKQRLLCIFPTGHGKSLIYQLPACLLDGITLVISPLLALMRDQISQLKSRFQINAASINTDQTDEENEQAKASALKGELKILFIAPEKLDQLDYFSFFLNLPVKLLVIDEAHCISTWGHDFRPSYRQIIRFLHALEQKTEDLKVLGLTATANQAAEDDIKKQISFQDRKVTTLRESMDRPNISLSCISLKTMIEKLAALEIFLLSQKGVGLIYCATRENTEFVRDYLKTCNIKIAAYHAGLESAEKRQLQQEFSADQYMAIAATNAFGMGIDKQNLRFVIHFDFPGSITAYYQEVGRCGRDGLASNGLLLYYPQDKHVQHYFIDSSEPKQEDFSKIMEAIQSAKEPLTLTDIKLKTGLHPTKVTVILAELIEQQFLKKELQERKQVYLPLVNSHLIHLDRYEQQHKIKTNELNKIISYSEETNKCRMMILREALGDLTSAPCNNCDLCKGTLKTLEIDEEKRQIIKRWLNERATPIPSAKLAKMEAGLSVLDGTIRTPLFATFMKERTLTSLRPFHLEDELLELSLKHLKSLFENEKFTSIVLVPSRTFQAGKRIATHFGTYFNVPVFTELLSWKKEPANRQGELLNNDQRKVNVDQLMQCDPAFCIPKGPILLFDDYIGSGATMKEAARAFYKSKKSSCKLIPFTIARVKWQLGKTGFV